MQEETNQEHHKLVSYLFFKYQIYYLLHSKLAE